MHYLLFALFVCFFLAVNAATIYVDPSAASSGTCLSASDPCATIEDAFLIADNDVVLLAPGVYSGDGNEALKSKNYTGTNLTLSGNSPNAGDIIINCTQETGGFLTADDNFIVATLNFTVQNCKSFLGPGFYFQGPSDIITLSNMVFFKNEAERSGGAIYGEGGIVLVISNSWFYNNTAAYDGGAISNQRSSTYSVMSDTIFEGNNAKGDVYTDAQGFSFENGGLGGAIYTVGSGIHFYGCTFKDNAAISAGGGIYFEDNIHVNNLYNTTFTSNRVLGGNGVCTADSSCDIRGGALFATDSALNLIDCGFHNNVAATANVQQLAQGGALYSMSSTSTTTVNTTMERCEFVRNVAIGIDSNNGGGFGGAMYLSNQVIDIVDSVFDSNNVGIETLFAGMASSGGALWVSSPLKSVISRCIFQNNFAVGGSGGAIFVTDAVSLVFEHNILTDNIAISSYTVVANGGALMVGHEANVDVSFCTFTGNMVEPRFDLTPMTLSGGGGAVYIQTAKSNVSHCEFFNNTAFTGEFDDGAGGGALVYENSGTSSIMNSKFEGNGAFGFSGFSSYSSSGQGGAVYVKYSSVHIAGCKFEANFVTSGGSEYSSGGAIMISFDYVGHGAYVPAVTIIDCIFAVNFAWGSICSSSDSKSGQGGAVSVVGSTNPGTFFSGCTFAGNVAKSDSSGMVNSFGGAVYSSQGSNITGQNCLFEYNYAWNGVGDDMYLSNSDNAPGTYTSIEMTNATLIALNTSTQELMEKLVGHFSDDICDKQVTVTSASANRRSLISSNDYKLSSTREEGSVESASVPHAAKLQMEAESHRIEQVKMRLSAQWRLEKHKHDQFRDLKVYGLDGKYIPILNRQLESNDHNSLRVVLDSPSVCVNGVLTLSDATFVGDYQIFCGSITEIISQETSSEALAVLNVKSSHNTHTQDTQTGLKVTAFRSNVSLVDTSSVYHMSIQRLNALNSTISVSNNITVLESSFITSSTLTAILPKYIEHDAVRPSYTTLTFNSNLMTGIDKSFPSASDGLLDYLTNNYFYPMIIFEECTVVILSSLNISTVTVVTTNGTILLPIVLDLTRHGMLNITKSGHFHVSTPTNITTANDDTRALLNDGMIHLGVTNGYFCNLEVASSIVQSTTGITSIVYDDATDTATSFRPALAMHDNATFFGTITASFTSGTTIQLYDTSQPTSWVIALFDEVGVVADDTLALDVPNGLGFSEESSHARELTMTVSNMACGVIETYYPNVSTGATLCQVCLYNASCNYCGTSTSTGSGGTVVGSCQLSNTCDDAYMVYDSTCCPSNCHGSHGTCKGGYDSSGNFEYYCECSIFWQPSDCAQLSTVSWILISSGVFLCILVLLIVYYYFRTKLQKNQVLEDLRNGLLYNNESTGDAQEENVRKTYLQSLQQDLILKDVFVKYEEIKLEAKIGEGSFGVVYRATFRGAQVAVKQMRSPLFQALSEGDIEEFRKEAYMMSRLRHPNIVLVMGISLVDQEPVTKRLKHPDEDEDFNVDKPDKNKPASKTVCIITEYLDQGSLADILYGDTRLAAETWTYELVLTCALQAARGMLYLHSHSPPICHRDLKSSNLVVDDHWVVKVTDFGMSRIIPEKHQSHSYNVKSELPKSAEEKAIATAAKLHQELEDHPDYAGRESIITSPIPIGHSSQTEEELEIENPIQMHHHDHDKKSTFNPEMTSNLGTTAWCAPELLAAGTKTRYSVKVDVYSFGMVLWELWERKRPYEELDSRFDIMDAIRSGRRPSISDDCPPPYRSLMQRCWQGDPSRRPMFQYIVRYIKEELARVKRNRAASMDRSLSGASSMSPADLHMLRNAAFSPQGSDVSSNLAMSPGATSPPIRNNVPSWSISGAYSAEGGRTTSMDNTSPVTSSMPPLTSQNPPVGAFDRVPVYTSSAPVDSQALAGSYTGRTRTVSKDNVVTQSPLKSAAAGWRDNFVLRQSGWKPSQPDSGLPPSMAGTTGPGAGRRTGGGGIMGNPAAASNIGATQPREQSFSYDDPTTKKSFSMEADPEGKPQSKPDTSFLGRVFNRNSGSTSSDQPPL